MVTTYKKLRAQEWTWSGSGFTRQTPSEKQLAAPKPSLVYKRARYYHPGLGQFISRDPLGYVDGMSQYRAYFVPRGVDPFGLDWLDVAADFSAGLGDGMSFGISYLIRSNLIDDRIDYDSGSYSTGGWTGVAVDVVTGGGTAIIKSGGKRLCIEAAEEVAEEVVEQAGKRLAAELTQETVEMGGKLAAQRLLPKLGNLHTVKELAFEVSTSQGPVEVLMQLSVKGRKIAIETALYPKGFNGAARDFAGKYRKEVWKAIRELSADAKSQGFEVLEVFGRRAENSSSAKVGEIQTIVIDLLKKGSK